jgi:hypothetical protein
MPAFFRILTIAGLLAILIACSDNNPILGKWQAKEGAQNLAADTIEFTDSQTITGGSADSATYKIDGKQITVTGSLGFDVIYTLEDKNTLAVNLPGTGRVVYTRIGQ